MRRITSLMLLYILTIVLVTIILAVMTSLLFSFKSGLLTGLSLGIEACPEIFMFLLIPVAAFQIIKSQIRNPNSRTRLILRISLFSAIVLVIFSLLQLISSRNFHFILSTEFLTFVLYTLITATAITVVDALLVKKLSYQI